MYNPSKTADDEFADSSLITSDLTNIICRQEKDLANYDKERVASNIKEVRAMKDQKHQASLQLINDKSSSKMKRIQCLLQEKGAGAWLTTRPIKSLGFALNKQEFKDAICLRYGWRVPNTPTQCQC